MHVVVVKWQQRNVPKRLIHRVQNDYFSLVFVHTRPDSFSCRYEKILYNGTPIRYVNLYFKDRRGADSLRYRNRAKITVLMCEQKPYSV